MIRVIENRVNRISLDLLDCRLIQIVRLLISFLRHQK